MSASKRARVDSWHAPQQEQAVLSRTQRNDRVRRESLDADALQESLQVLVERQQAVIDDLRRLNSHFLPVAIQPLISQGIKTADYTLQHCQSALLLLQAGAGQ